MNKILTFTIRSTVRLMIYLLIITSSSLSYASDVYLKPYLGIDAQFRFMSFREGFGAKNFRNRYPQANIFGGLKFCDYLGIEAGYFSSVDLTRNSTFGPNEVNLGVSEFPASINSIGSSRIQGWHINLMGYVPISEEYCLTALGYIGASQSKVTLRYIVTEIAGEQEDFTANFSQTKTIMRAGLGLQHMISNCIGVRGIVGWEDTSKFNAIRSPVDPNLLVKLKSSVVLSFGIFAIF